MPSSGLRVGFSFGDDSRLLEGDEMYLTHRGQTDINKVEECVPGVRESACLTAD